MIQKRVLRTGDGSHEYAKKLTNNNTIETTPVERDVEHFWGWNDETMRTEDREDVTIINKTDE